MKIPFTILILLHNFCSAVIREASDLSCDFQNDYCSWKNLRSLYNNSWTIENRVVSGLFNSIPRGVLGLGDSFVTVSGKRQAEDVFLISDVIACQQTPAHLGFFIWKSSVTSNLQVCHRVPPGRDGLLNCFAKFSGYIGMEWIAVYVVVPAIHEPFEIVFRGSVRFYIDVLAIDKVMYEASSICNPAFSTIFGSQKVTPVDSSPLLRRPVTPPSIPKMQPIRRDPPILHSAPIAREILPELRLPPLLDIAVGSRPNRENRRIRHRERKSFAASCDALQCTFETGLCDFETDEHLSNNGRLRISCSHINLPMAVIIPKQGDCFLLSTTTLNFRVRKVLASRLVFTTGYSELVFDYYLPVDATSRLQVCIGNMRNCIWSATRPKRSLQRWWKQRLQLQPGKLQVFFVLEHMARGSFVALDDIRLVEMNESQKTATCEMYADDGETAFPMSSLRERSSPIPFFSDLHLDNLLAVNDNNPRYNDDPPNQYTDFHSNEDMFNFDIDFG